MDCAIPSGRLYPSYTVKELETFIANPVYSDSAGKMRLAIRQRDPNHPAFIPTLHQRLNAARSDPLPTMAEIETQMRALLA